MEGFGRIPVSGKPYLPSKIFSVAVPPGAEVTGVTFETGRVTELDGEYKIIPVPVQKMVIDSDPLGFNQKQQKAFEANFASVYGVEVTYPSVPCEMVGVGGYRKYNLVDIRISPFAWHSGTGKLTLYSSVTAHIHYNLPERLSQDVVLVDSLARTESRARTLVYNYEQAQSWYPTQTQGRGLYDYVIITLSTLTTQVQPLVDWETAKGRNVQVVTTDWINTNYTGYDLAEKMRNFLRDKYPSAEWGIEDVCLVGHYDDVPMRRCEQDLGYGKPETDYYYAELSKPDNQSWDLDGDHRWGEDTDPIDFTAEVNVGRIPWSSTANVSNICNKSVAFENNSDPTFKKNILLLGAFFWSDTDNAVLMEYKTNPANNPWMSDWTTTKLYEVGQTSYACDGDLKWNNVRDVWSAGKYAFVNWAGHGSPSGCYIMYSTGEAFATNSTCVHLNDNYPSIIFADACSNSDTDYLNIGQAMLQRGAVGFLGSTKVALGCPGWNSQNDGSSQSLDYYFTSNVTSGNYTIGSGHQDALRTMYTNGLWGYTKYEMFEWGAIWGQPNLGMAEAPALTIGFPEGLPETQPPGLENKITVEIRDGLESYVPGSGRLFYRFDSSDPFTPVTLTSMGGDLFEAVIPNTVPGNEPEFYFSAEGDGSSMVYSPYGAPSEAYAFDVCFIEVLMVNDFETNQGWSVQNTNVDTGAWVRANPAGTDAQPEDDHTPTGTMCYVTGAAGGSIGNDDLDGGPTRLSSPTIDLSAGDAMIDYYLWFYHSTNGNFEPLIVQVSNNNGSTWANVASLSHAPSWSHYTFKVSDYVTPTAQIKVRFSADDSPNDSVVEALLDDFKVERLTVEAALWANAYEIDVSTQSVVDFSMDAGAANGNRNYLLLGSMSGTSPGFTLPGGAVLPLNWDSFTDLLLQFLNTTVCQNFYSTLDAAGTATATLDTISAIDPVVVGETANFAFVLNFPFDYTSNPISVVYVP